MVMSALLLASVLAKNDQPHPRYTTRQCSKSPGGRSARGVPCDDGAFFEFAPASGMGLPSSADLCAQFTALKPAASTQAWCTRGDGTTAAGDITVGTAIGTPINTSLAVCPNGPDCTAKTGLRATSTTSGVYTESADQARGGSKTSGAFTACAEFTLGVNALEKTLIGNSLNGSGQWQYLLYINNATSNVSAYTSNAACGGATGSIGPFSLTPGTHNLACVTWSASDGIYRLYVNGVAGSTSAGFGTICSGGANSRHALGGFYNASGAVAEGNTSGQVYAGFYLDSVGGDFSGQLTPTQMTNLANAMGVATDAHLVTGARGEVLTYTRAVPVFCDSSSGVGSMVAANVPCTAHSNKLRSWQSYTQDVLRNQELENVVWTATATVTADQGLTPWGEFSADLLNDASAVTLAGVSQSVATASQTKHTLSAWIAPGTLAKATCTMNGTGNSAGDCSVSNGAIPAGGALLTCTSTAAYGAGLTAVTVACTVGTVVADTGTILVSFIDHEANVSSGTPPHCLAIGSTCTPGNEQPTFSGVSVASVLSTGCAAGTTETTFAGGSAVGGVVSWGTNGRALYFNAPNIGLYNGTNLLLLANGLSAGAPLTRRWRSTWTNGGSAFVYNVNDVTNTSGAFTVPFTTGTLVLGYESGAGVYLNGWVGQTQLDPNISRCL